MPQRHSDQVAKGRVTKAGKPRYRYQNSNCPRDAFVLAPSYQGHFPEVKEQIIDMALNGSGIPDTALSRVNQRLLALLNPDKVEVVSRLADGTEADEM